MRQSVVWRWSIAARAALSHKPMIKNELHGTGYCIQSFRWRAFVHRSDAAASSIRQVPIASAGRAKRGVKGHCDYGAAARPTAAHAAIVSVSSSSSSCARPCQPSAWRQAAGVSGGRGGLRQLRLESLGRPSRPALVAFARRRCHRERRTTAALEWLYLLTALRHHPWRRMAGLGWRFCRRHAKV
jgi:hypothetical protein